MTWTQFVTFVGTPEGAVLLSALLGGLASLLYKAWQCWPWLPGKPDSSQHLQTWLASLLHVLVASGPAIWASLQQGQYLVALLALAAALAANKTVYDVQKNLGTRTCTAAEGD